MKKQDLLIVVLLFALWMAWPLVDRHVIAKIFPPKPAPAATALSPAEASTNAFTASVPPSSEPEMAEAKPEPAEAAPPPAQPEPARPTALERTLLLTNNLAEYTFSSWGGTLVSARLRNYRKTVSPDSGPVVLDFNASRALAVLNVPGFSAGDDFEMTPGPDAQSVVFEKTAADGLQWRRAITLADHYLLSVEDQLTNGGTAPIALENSGLQLGPMGNLPGETMDKSVAYLGVDSLSPGGEGVQYWGSSIPKWFKTEQEQQALPKLPMTIRWTLKRDDGEARPVDWAAAKNKYFAQILSPEGGADRCETTARRQTAPREIADPAFAPKMTGVEEVSAAVYFPPLSLEPGKAFTRSIKFYVGPKEFSELNKYGAHWVEVMEFGFWRPVGKILLQIMNWIYTFIWPHNYGLAIMLLTIIIRIVFWPVTHKSTESMKKMQALQPLMTEIRQKYKDNAQKQQQEIMALYKTHKVNPLSGCLPMLVQIPVFIALFVVLRSAIELRFASFLWIKDLSAPENLFKDVLPIPLNILPLLMAATMFWQQKLTPSTGDPQQQKIMMFMPVMMLVFFYSFASGLSLYWTTNQCLMIVQLLWQKKKQAARSAVLKQ